MVNPFEILSERLSHIEALLLDIKHGSPSIIRVSDETEYAGFPWLLTVYPFPESTVRQHISRGMIPGVKKVGKRLLFDKAVVLQWLKNQQHSNVGIVADQAEESFRQKHDRMLK